MMRLLGHRVLVLLPPKQTERDDATGFSVKRGESLIVLAKAADTYDAEVSTRGIVIQGATEDFSVGDCVIFPPTVGEAFTHEGFACRLLREDDIAAVLEPSGRELDWVQRLAMVTHNRWQALKQQTTPIFEELEQSA